MIAFRPTRSSQPIGYLCEPLRICKADIHPNRYLADTWGPSTCGGVACYSFPSIELLIPCAFLSVVYVIPDIRLSCLVFQSLPSRLILGEQEQRGLHVGIRSSTASCLSNLDR